MELAALILESYERTYGNMVRVQQLAELEETTASCPRPNSAAGARVRGREFYSCRASPTFSGTDLWLAISR